MPSMLTLLNLTIPRGGTPPSAVKTHTLLCRQMIPIPLGASAPHRLPIRQPLHSRKVPKRGVQSPEKGPLGILSQKRNKSENENGGAQSRAGKAATILGFKTTLLGSLQNGQKATCVYLPENCVRLRHRSIRTHLQIFIHRPALYPPPPKKKTVPSPAWRRRWKFTSTTPKNRESKGCRTQGMRITQPHEPM